MEQVWFTMIGSLGFPIVLTFYLLARLEKGFKQLEQIIVELISEIQRGGYK